MKKLFIIIIIINMFLLKSSFLNATCEELHDFLNNEQYAQVSEMLTDKEEPYLLIEVYNVFFPSIYVVIEEDYNNTKTKYTYENEDDNYLSIIYRDVNRSTKYKVKVYGNINECKDELLKTIEFDTSVINQYYYSDVCIENRGYEKCGAFSDTKDISLEDLEKEIKEYNEESNTFLNLNRGLYLYILIPILIIGIYFTVRIIKIKRSNKK